MIYFLISILILIALISYIYWFKPYSGAGTHLQPKGYTLTMVILALIALYAGYQTFDNWQHQQRFQISQTTSEYPVTLQGKKGDLMMAKQQDIKMNEAYESLFYLWSDQKISSNDLSIKAEEKNSGDKVQLQASNLKEPAEKSQTLKQELGATNILQSKIAFPYFGIWELAVYQNNEKIGDIVIEVER